MAPPRKTDSGNGGVNGCRDCPTAAAVTILESRQLADLSHWAELRCDITSNEQRRTEQFDALTDELHRITDLLLDMLEKVADLDETIRNV